MPPHDADQPGTWPGPTDRRDLEIGELRRCLSEMSEQLVRSQAEVLAVEAELGAARARIAELEARLHVRIVEVVELRNGRSDPAVSPWSTRG